MADGAEKHVAFLVDDGEVVPARIDLPEPATDGNVAACDCDHKEESSLDDSEESEPSFDEDRRRSLCEAIGIKDLPVFNVHDRDPDTMEEARALVDHLKAKYGFVEPDRGNLDDPLINWREGRKPDYTIANLQWMLGKTKNHEPGSLEMIVENMVKTWEMEATHKLFQEWTTVNHSKYSVQANGGKEFSADEAGWVGNYNWLLDAADKELYDNSKETFESSHGLFRYAFPEGFPWEVLEVFSGPPRVAFSWRHWATFSGEYKGNKGIGKTVTMTGFGVIFLEDMKVSKIDIFYKPNDFIEVLLGRNDASVLDESGAAYGEPVVLKMSREGAGECPSAHSNDGACGGDTDGESDNGGKCPFMHSSDISDKSEG